MGFAEQFDEVMGQIGLAYFGPGEVFTDPGDVAAILLAHAEDHEEDDEPGPVRILRMAAERLTIAGAVALREADRLKAAEEALALVKLYRKAQEGAS